MDYNNSKGRLSCLELVSIFPDKPKYLLKHTVCVCFLNIRLKDTIQSVILQHLFLCESSVFNVERNAHLLRIETDGRQNVLHFENKNKSVELDE